MPNRKPFSPPPLPANAKAALLFLEGGLVWYRYVRETGIQVKPVSPQALRAVVSKIPVDSGWLQPSIRRWGLSPAGEYALTLEPAHTRTLILQARGSATRQTIDVALPTLAMLGVGHVYYLWALLDPPGPGARLAYPPLPNVHANAAVCWGENRPPAQVTPKAVVRAMELFLTSAFTSDEVVNRSRKHPKDVRQTLIELDGQPTPPEWLVPFTGGRTPATLETVVQHLTTQHRNRS
jgi:hypothetical protein